MGRAFLMSVIFMMPAWHSGGLLAQNMTYSTDSDSAIFFYKKGWQTIMDYGQYTLSEKYFRKSVAFDPDFLLALAQVARLSDDPEEISIISEQIENDFDQVSQAEAQLLEGFLYLVKYTLHKKANHQDQAQIQLQLALQTSAENLQTFVRKYPDELYHGCEYIEVTNYLSGPDAAMDTLYALNNPELEENIFMLGYQVKLLGEMGNTSKAKEKLMQLEAILNKKVPKTHVVRAQYHIHTHDFRSAETEIQKALTLDPGNIDAQRLEQALNQR
jgi:tetratricopeptide (TPR) repeat protein